MVFFSARLTLWGVFTSQVIEGNAILRVRLRHIQLDTAKTDGAIDEAVPFSDYKMLKQVIGTIILLVYVGSMWCSNRLHK